MTCPANLQLCFLQSTTWTIPFRITLEGVAVSLAGATITAKLRYQIDDAAAAASFSCSVVDAANGQGQAVLSAATTAALTYDTSPTNEDNQTQFFWDLLILLSGGDTIAPLSGIILAGKAASR